MSPSADLAPRGGLDARERVLGREKGSFTGPTPPRKPCAQPDAEVQRDADRVLFDREMNVPEIHGASILLAVLDPREA